MAENNGVLHVGSISSYFNSEISVQSEIIYNRENGKKINERNDNVYVTVKRDLKTKLNSIMNMKWKAIGALIFLNSYHSITKMGVISKVETGKRKTHLIVWSEIAPKFS